MRLRTNLYAATVASFLCSSAQAEWVNALKPQGKPAGKVKVVKAGKPQGGIQLPDRPTPQETNAAVELQHWIRELTGATMEIKTGKARSEPDGHTLMFGYVGTHAMNPALQKLRYDPATDFAPIGMVGSSPTTPEPRTSCTRPIESVMCQ